MTENKNNTLTLPRPANAISELLRDFDGFFNFNPFINWDNDIPTLRNTLIDRTGFPRANVKNVSTKDEERLLFELALPGWNHDNSKLDITIDKGILKIEGTFDGDEEEPMTKSERYGKEYEHNISSKSKFTLSHSVTEDTEFESAKLKDGLLKVIVKLPQPDKPQPKRITVD